MKKTTFSAMLVTCLGFFTQQPVLANGIPVIDTSNLTQQLLQVEHLVAQIQQLEYQLETAQQALANISGSRGLATIIDSVYDPFVDVDIEEVLNGVGLKSADEHGLSGELAAFYDETNQAIGQWLGQSQKSLQQTQARFDELTTLIGKVNDSPDQKDILDLQARIGAEEVLLQNELIKLTLLQSQAQANQVIREQQIRQRMMESSGELHPVPW